MSWLSNIKDNMEAIPDYFNGQLYNELNKTKHKKMNKLRRRIEKLNNELNAARNDLAELMDPK